MSSIVQIFTDIKAKAKASVKTCQRDPSLVQEHLRLNQLHFELVTHLFTESAKTGPEKRRCEFTYAYITHVKDTLTALTVKVGGGVDTVKWIPMDIAFERNIQTGLIKNLKHLDIKEFLEAAFEVFKQVVSGVIREKGAVKVYTVLVAEYEMQTDSKDLVENKYFNTPAVCIFPSADMKTLLILY